MRGKFSLVNFDTKEEVICKFETTDTYTPEDLFCLAMELWFECGFTFSS